MSERIEGRQYGNEPFGLSLPALRLYRQLTGVRESELPLLWRLANDEGTTADLLAMRAMLCAMHVRALSHKQATDRLLLLGLVEDLLRLPTEPCPAPSWSLDHGAFE